METHTQTCKIRHQKHKMRGQSKNRECLELKQKAEKAGCQSRLAKTIVVPPTVGWRKSRFVT